jgi:hypothetical protein
MRLSFILLLISLVLLGTPAAYAQPEEVDSTEMIDYAYELDGSPVMYRGEVIGDILYRGENAWIEVSDGINAIGCFVASEEAHAITHVGRYGEHGDIVEVIGVFHRACSEHGGDLDLHAASVEIVELGYEVVKPISLGMLIAAVTAFLCAALLGILVVRRRR